jgi:hypothetical protein
LRFISHRGNLKGRISERENAPDYVDEAIAAGFDVEIDVWRVDGKHFLGHDIPQYKVDLQWLLDRNEYLWCHAKNLDALHDMIHYPKLNVFWHQEDDYTITTHNFIWTYPEKNIRKYSYRQVILLFDWIYEDVEIPHGGICSDEIILYKNKYG